MKCENVRGELVAYIDGEPSLAQTCAITGHLASCPGCRAESEQLREIVERTREAEPVQPPQDWWEKLRVRIHTFQTKSSTGRRDGVPNSRYVPRSN